MSRIKSAKNVLFVVVVLLCQGCLPGTTFKGTKFCPAYLKEGDGIMVGVLQDKNWNGQIASIREELKGRKINVFYAPEEEWNLRAAGIVNPLDTTNYPRLIEKGITHILLVREVSTSRGDFYNYRTPHEIAQELNPFHPYKTDQSANDYKAELAVYLLSLRTSQSYSFNVLSEINGLQIKEDDGGRSTVNAGSVQQARNVAVRKSAQRLAKYCR